MKRDGDQSAVEIYQSIERVLSLLQALTQSHRRERYITTDFERLICSNVCVLMNDYLHGLFSDDDRTELHMT